MKTFTSPDHLAALVSQALAAFNERRHRASSMLSTHRRITVRADSAADLRAYPDLTVQIGASEDDLPLLVRIQRSRNLTQHFEAISDIIRRPGLEAPGALMNSFRQSIEEHATKVWANDGIETVVMRDGSKQQLFVTSQRGAGVREERLPRITRLLALAFRLEDLLRGRTIGNSAELARLGGVSRARITQILNLRNLAPAIQEEILSVTPGGRVENLTEGSLRRLTAILDWRRQAHFEQMLQAGGNTVRLERVGAQRGRTPAAL